MSAYIQPSSIPISAMIGIDKRKIESRPPEEVYNLHGSKHVDRGADTYRAYSVALIENLPGSINNPYRVDPVPGPKINVRI